MTDMARWDTNINDYVNLPNSSQMIRRVNDPMETIPEEAVYIQTSDMSDYPIQQTMNPEYVTCRIEEMRSRGDRKTSDIKLGSIIRRLQEKSTEESELERVLEQVRQNLIDSLTLIEKSRIKKRPRVKWYRRWLCC